MEVGSELSKVTWPPWKDTKRATIVVMVTTLIIAGILGLLDLAWGSLTRLFYS
jgi:preprotein translocase SecE subunit